MSLESVFWLPLATKRKSAPRSCRQAAIAVRASRASTATVRPPMSGIRSMAGMKMPISLAAFSLSFPPSSMVGTAFLRQWRGGAMAAGAKDMGLPALVIDGAADGLAIDGDARILVPAMVPAEAGRGRGKLAGTDRDHDVADATDAREVMGAISGPGKAEMPRHPRPEVLDPGMDPLAPHSVAAAQSDSSVGRRCRRPRGSSTSAKQSCRPAISAVFILRIFPVP